MSSKPTVALYFNWLTPFFDFLTAISGYGNRLHQRTLELLALQPGERLLDVGCGTGSFLVFAKTQYPNLKATGIDLDPRILRQANRKIASQKLEITLHETSADTLPFPDQSFEAVVSTLAFHHFPTEVKAGALKEIARVLASEGRFLLVDFGESHSLWTHLTLLFLRVIGSSEATTALDNSQGRIPGLIAEAGFDFQKVARRYKGLDFWLCKKKLLSENSL